MVNIIQYEKNLLKHNQRDLKNATILMRASIPTKKRRKITYIARMDSYCAFVSFPTLIIIMRKKKTHSMGLYAYQSSKLGTNHQSVFIQLLMSLL